MWASDLIDYSAETTFFEIMCKSGDLRHGRYNEALVSLDSVSPKPE